MLRLLFARLQHLHVATSLAALTLSAVLLTTPNAHAVRPFVTDDAEVVGDRQLEIATWIEGGSKFFEHSLELTFGITHWLEVGLGIVHGVDYGSYGLLGPMFHVKAALRDLPDNGWTLAASAGGIAPVGHGSYKPDGGVGFASGIFTQSFRDGNILIHANLGAAFEHHSAGTHWTPTAAFGTQFHLISILYGITEVFYSDPLSPMKEFGAQVGLRVMFTDYIQLDATGGTEFTLNGNVHPWGTLGVRFLTKEPKAAIASEQDRDARKELHQNEQNAGNNNDASDNGVSDDDNGDKDDANDNNGDNNASKDASDDSGDNDVSNNNDSDDSGDNDKPETPPQNTIEQ